MTTALQSPPHVAAEQAIQTAAKARASTLVYRGLGEPFQIAARHGSHEPAACGGALGELRRKTDHQRSAFAARERLRSWTVEEMQP